MKKQEIVVFESRDGEVRLDVGFDEKHSLAYKKARWQCCSKGIER